MPVLKLFRTIANPGRLEPVGTLLVEDDGSLTPETDDDILDRILRGLKVTASMRGEPVTPEDPHYVDAVADSVGRETAWHFVAEKG